MSDDFIYIPNFLSNEMQQTLFNYLESTGDFIPTYQYTDNISRYQKWYQTDMKYFCPVWKQRFPHWESFQMDDTIKNLIDMIKQSNIVNININSCLINKYPNGNHFISPHRDSPDSFGEEPVIIVLSIGDMRTLLFENNMKKFSYDLESGSIFIMRGQSQKEYLHSIPKSDSMNVRYSFTFREFIL